jgi:tetratricopeptide (TPR) repeat protein
MELKSLEPEESKSFLLARTRRSDDDPTESEAVRVLAEELGHLPLALEQAAAYIAKHEEAFADYLKEYRRIRLALLDLEAPVIGAYPLSVRTTWRRSFDAIQAQYPASAALLRISAFFGPDRIPYRMILEGAEEMGAVVVEALSPEFDVHSLNRLLTPLAEHSLVRRLHRVGAYEIHRMVQLVIRDELAEADRLDFIKKSVLALNRSLPDAAFSCGPRYQDLIAHAMVAAEWIEAEKLTAQEAGRVLNYAANVHAIRADFGKAKHFGRLALRTTLRALGRDNLRVSDILGSIATICEHQGLLRRAELIFIISLNICIAIVGRFHIGTAKLLVSLASCYSNQARYVDAEKMFRSALEVINHPNFDCPDERVLTTCLNNLGALYFQQGRLIEAAHLYQRALAIRENALAPDHPDLATSLFNLASVYHEQKRTPEAEDHLTRALEIRRRILGANHPLTAQCLQNLGVIYIDTGRYLEAETLLLEGLEITKKSVGENHHQTAQILNSLTVAQENLGRKEDFEKIYLNALSIIQVSRGPEHPDLAPALSNLAYLYFRKRRFGNAEALIRRAIGIYNNKLPTHPIKKILLQRLAMIISGRTPPSATTEPEVHRPNAEAG